MASAEPNLFKWYRHSWLWPGRPPHDVGAALCAGLVFVAGIVVATVRGGRAFREI